jgi:phosphatidate cytidylyltransferase
MLKQRLITAAILIPAMVAALWFLPTTAVIVLFGLFVALGAAEWATLAGLSGRARYGYATIIVVCGLVLIEAIRIAPVVAPITFAVAFLWWVFAAWSFSRDIAGIYRTQTGRLLAGLLVLIPAWVALSTLHFVKVDANSPRALLYLLVLVGVADSAAYAAGHAFGRHKLAPAISPGKTLEGALGALVAVVALAFFCGTMIWQYSGTTLRIWIALSVATLVVSIIGDLVESKLKRIAGVKDSGTLLPGHGGVLDRIDAITAAAPLFALGWLLWFDVHA